MSTLLRLAHQLLIALLGITVLVLMVPVSMQIGSRFFEWIPNYMWTEEMSRFFFIWMVMIGATVGVREGLHFDVDIWCWSSANATTSTECTYEFCCFDAGHRSPGAVWCILFVADLARSGGLCTGFGLLARVVD
ncbi:MAG: TRAP transporter small permease subunit [Burkholderiaceae bacterium]|nr:TRAP transporter small permease subunit [Burkholderiaceae bacterium]